jgi:hypothetical protein
MEWHWSRKPFKISGIMFHYTGDISLGISVSPRALNLEIHLPLFFIRLGRL